MVIVHGSQDNNATATVLWDNAFAEPVSQSLCVSGVQGSHVADFNDFLQHFDVAYLALVETVNPPPSAGTCAFPRAR